MLGSISSSYLPVNFYQTPWHLPDFPEVWLMKFIIDQGNHAGQVTYQHYQPEKVTHLLYFLGQLSRGVVILLYFCLLMMVLAWLLYGLPKKAQ